MEIDFHQQCQEINWEKKQSSSTYTAVTTNINMQKNEVGLLPHIMKINSKYIKGLSVRTKL